MVNSNTFSSRITGALILSFSVFVALPQAALAEGSAQIGLTQRLVDFQAQDTPNPGSDPVYAIDDASRSLYVDVVSVGEVINVSLCGTADADLVEVDIYDESGTLVYDGSSAPGNIACNSAMDTVITNAQQYVTTSTGAHRLILQNNSGNSFFDSYFERYDITVTPNTGVDPDPSIAGGRLWAYSWNMNAGAFTEARSTDANLYALVPGGRPNTNYVWMLDLNNMAGYGYNIIANATGVTAPNSGFSTPTSGNTATYLYPVYTGVPAIAQPQPVVPPQVSDVRFIDDAGQDNGISPAFTPDQNSGFFEFRSDVPGTYAIFVDVNQNSVFGDTGDVFLLGMAAGDPVSPPLNRIAWDGRDPNGNFLPLGSYNARVAVRLGEYHFVANDIETSGGGTANGLTVYLSDLSGNLSDTLVYWDDATLLTPSGTSTRPLGELSSAPAAKHTWGNFTSSGFGNVRFIDTYVYGLATATSSSVVILDNDNPLTGADGTISVDQYILRNDTLNISLTDPDLNTGSTAIEQVVITVTNDVTGEIEQITLTETGVNTGVFTGSLPTTFGTIAGANNSSNMNAQEGDTLTASYEDQLDSSGNNVTRTDTSTVTFDRDSDGVVDPLDADDDNDGIPDASEAAGDADGDGLANSVDIDADGDGIPDNIEAQAEGSYRPPTGSDSDGDGLDNEYDPSTGGTAITIVNSDGTGAADYLDTDADDDGVLDAVEGHDANSNGVAERTPAGADDDNDGLDNAYDNVALPAAGNATGSDADLQDTDGDATRDWRDTDDDNDTASTFSEDDNNDSNWVNDDDDLDGLPNYLESATTDADGDGTPAEQDPNESNACIPNTIAPGCTLDDDADGIDNSTELANGTDPTDPDSDNDGLTDGAEVGVNGIQDGGETNPLDADTDDDGLSDGVEVLGLDGVPSSGDELDRLAADSDADGLFDGTEAGVTVAIAGGVSDGNSTPYTGTDTGAGNFVADADPASTTNPAVADTDGDTLNDGVEDANGDGATVNTIGGTGTGGSGETDPNNADTDGDGLNDNVEIAGSGPLTSYGFTDPLDTDTDDGGTQDGTEALTDNTDPTAGNGGDDLANDPDGDGLSSTEEAILGTDPNDADTDNDGIGDNDELGNDGSFDTGDTNPLDADTDNDGLSDGVEVLGLDGVPSSGDELDPLAADSDGDGILDGTEAGVTGAVAGGVSDGDGVAFTGTDTGAGNFVADADPASTTNPANTDTDGDGLDDGVEDANGDGATVNTIGGTGTGSSGETDPNNADTDGDGLNDGNETNGDGPLAAFGATDPLDTDTDDGGTADGTEALTDGTDPTVGNGGDDFVNDPDGDGLTNAQEAALGTDPNDGDTDNDGLTDGEEVGANGTFDTGETNPLDGDTDDDGLADGVEVNGSGPLSTYGATDPLVADSDGDGLSDGLEAGETAGLSAGVSDGNGTPYDGTDVSFTGDADPATTTNALAADTDGDGLDDGVEDANQDGQTVNTIGGTGNSGTGETDPDLVDTDGDGLSDGNEVNATGPLAGIGATDPLDTDTDDGGTQDGTEVLADGTNPTFGNGGDDFGADPDGDGLSNLQEAALGTDPDDADTDNDGIDDGDELGNDASFDAGDTDPLDADTDDDGLLDGTELLGLDGIASSGDELDPLSADTDGDGLRDGTEAGVTAALPGGTSDGNGITFNGTDTGSPNFVADADPASTTNPANADTDGDGLSDGDEDANADGATVNTIGDSATSGSGETDPDVADTDGDGLSDGDEANATGPLAGIGATDPLDTDTDNGGTQDGTEVLVDGTNPTAGNGGDDLGGDPDGDGLSNAQEAVLGTDPDDADTDNDGIDDGDELGNDATFDAGDTNPLDADTDNDGLLDGAEVLGQDGAPLTGDETSPVLADTDGDGLTDGLELGVTAAVSGGASDGNAIAYNGTDTGSPNFVIDTDPASTTDPTDDDTDNDGLSDGTEDANGDGATSFVLGGTGTAGSGETDPNDADTDGDLLSDGNEVNATGDLSGIGSTDPLDTDTDDGGALDGIEVLNDFTDPNNPVDDLIDSDGDGINDGVDPAPNDACDPNFPGLGCLDSDNDGAADFGTPTTSVPVEPNVAANDDPCVPDNTVSACDSDGDGISDGDEIAAGTDPNNNDSDGDGIPDNQESGDTDGDGIIDALDTDSDNDGTPDSEEAGPNPGKLVDTDGDGTPDHLDTDSDEDGVPDAVEGSGDDDNDGLANFQDDDADNDGIPDAVEDGNLTGVDSDNDGIDDAYDVDVTGGDDVNLDGVDDSVMPIDTDGDGSPDFLDIDSDNDGIPDTLEADLDPAADADGDGINDVYDIDLTVGTDADGNGVDDNVMPTDTDGDGVPDYRDLDSDNDSLWDVSEAGGIDVDGDTIIDDAVTSQGTTTQPADDDGDTVPNHRDLDSDNDSINDIVGNLGELFDANGDGVIDDPTDSDGDGIADVVDLVDGFGTIADADLDDIPDNVEGTGDPDGDGIPNYLDTDSDGDGVSDAIEAGGDPRNPSDTDGDGMPDYLDTDSDNDGIPDSVDTGDKDGDGIPDRIDADEGQLRTAVSGSGSIGNAELLMLLLVMLATVALRARRGITLAAVLCCMTLPFVTVDKTYADDDVCGYTGAEFEGCWYAGLGLGLTHVAPEGQAAGWSTNDDKDSGWKIYGGYQFKPLWSVELAYVDGGEAGLGNVDPALEAFIPNASIDYTTPSIMAVRWLNEKDSPFNAFLRLGVSAISNSASDARIPFEEQTSIQLAGGIGAQFTFAERWFLRGDIDLYDRDHHYYGLSIGGNFGGAGKPVPTPAARPVPVAAPAPAPVVQPEPEPAPEPPPSMVCEDVVRTLSDITFETDSAVLRPGARYALDSVVGDLRAASADTVRVLAHTDSRGSDDYNLDLSTRRAQSVVNYLVYAGIDRNRLSSSGLGETQPIASNETASGRAQNRRVELVWRAERCQ